MHPSFFKKQKGTTLVETLVAVTFFVIVAVVIYNIYATTIQLNQRIKIKQLAVNVGNEMLEIARNLPYDDLGTVGGIPNGVLDDQIDVERLGYTFRINYTVRNVDLSFDGLSPTDTAPADNKLVEVKVRCQECRDSELGDFFYTFNTYVAPRSTEESTSTGVLNIYVVNSNGTKVPAANVSVVNSSVSPAVNLDDNTNADGLLQLIGALPSTAGYRIDVDKSNYSADRTYISSQIGGSTPVLSHASVTAGATTSITLQIDRTSTLNISSVDTACVAVSGFDFNLRGTKKIGTSPDVYKYDNDWATNGSGVRALTGMEWDTYQITPEDGTYDMVGSNPLLQFALPPNTTQSLQLVVASKNQPAVMVTVKDAATGLALTDADVNLEKDSGGYDVTKTTGVGSIVQTDWSGGKTQATYSDTTKYWDDDGNVNRSTTPGEMKLKNSGAVYRSSGWLESSTFDTGSVSNFYELTWLPTSQPAGTGADSVKFQVAANNDNATWNYIGPDGTNGTYYTTSDFDLADINGNRYLRIKAHLSTADTAYTPTVSDIGFTYSSSCTPPGQVYFSGLSSGAYTLTVSKSDYNDNIIPVTVSASGWQQIETSMSQ